MYFYIKKIYKYNYGIMNNNLLIKLQEKVKKNK